MDKLTECLAYHPLSPYIRQCDYAVRKPWNMPVRRLLDYLLIYVQEGECLFVVDGEELIFNAGSFALIQPNSLHTLEGRSRTITPFAHMDLFYNEAREQSFPTRAGQIDLSAYAHLLQPRLDELLERPIPVKLPSALVSQMRDPFLKAVEYWSYHTPRMDLHAQFAMMEVCLSLLRHYSDGLEKRQPPAQTLNWITSYLSYHLSEPISVGDMARRANLSVSRFNTLFKKHYRMTPHQYLLDMRVKHACELLRRSNASLEEIASYSGFADIHHFSKTFKSKTGRSPGRYRDEGADN
ncbi:AraC family transcriptional regulator [Paenibacillus chungangensis]|uniref:Helix-turn-helix domain-containing protein n=1 Tax=Paenibacillus chungangensis TaxID=696535 RepID=A0ABW3HLM9_9BACL